MMGYKRNDYRYNGQKYDYKEDGEIKHKMRLNCTYKESTGSIVVYVCVPVLSGIKSI